MNKKQRREFEQARHEMYIFKAAWLAFLGAQLVRFKKPNVIDFIQGIDGAIRSAVDAVAAGEVVSVRVEIWKQTDVFAALEAVDREITEMFERGDDIGALNEIERINEELRRQSTDDIPF